MTATKQKYKCDLAWFDSKYNQLKAASQLPVRVNLSFRWSAPDCIDRLQCAACLTWPYHFYIKSTPLQIKRLTEAVAILTNLILEIIEHRIEQIPVPQAAPPSLPPSPLAFTVLETGKYFTKIDIAEYFNVSTRTIDNWSRNRQIPYIKIGKLVRYPVQEVVRTLQDRYQLDAFPSERRSRSLARKFPRKRPSPSSNIRRAATIPLGKMTTRTQKVAQKWLSEKQFKEYCSVQVIELVQFKKWCTHQELNLEPSDP